MNNGAALKLSLLSHFVGCWRVFVQLNSKGPYLSSEKGKRKLLSRVQVLHKTDVKEVSVQSCIDSKVINKKRNLCSCKVGSFAFFAVFVAVAFVVA